MISEAAKQSDAFMQAWRMVWPELRKGIGERIIALGAGADCTSERAQAEVARYRELCTLFNTLEAVELPKHVSAPVIPPPLKVLNQ